MSWLPDEQYVLMQDIKDKKITARSAMKKRTHCGKGGTVKFPSDYLTKGQIKKMSGEVKSYKMNTPMTWDEFKDLPDDLKKIYIQTIRTKYGAPYSAIADMFGVASSLVGRWARTLGISDKLPEGCTLRTWDKEGFYAWRSNATDAAVEHTEVEVEEVPEPDQFDDEHDILLPRHEYAKERGTEEIKPAEPEIHTTNFMPVIPKKGSLTFEHNDADDALATIKALLSNVKVNITVSWECTFED